MFAERLTAEPFWLFPPGCRVASSVAQGSTTQSRRHCEARHHAFIQARAGDASDYTVTRTSISSIRATRRRNHSGAVTLSTT
jgi:hypothetical protein